MEQPAKKYTVTVGIPAYNEEVNICLTLESIIRQKQENYILEKIIVISDGSGDSTDEKVKDMAKKYPLISLLADGKRKGKTERLNELHGLNRSDIVVNFDADVILKDEYVLEKIIRHFSDGSVALVVGNNIPLPGRAFIERITNASDLLWYEVRKDFNGGDNIYNCAGSAAAIRGLYVRSMIFPPGTVADQQFVYLSVKRDKKKFIFEKEAVVSYRTPGSIEDFFKQAGRSLIEKKYIAHYFSEEMQDHYFIPASVKARAVSKRLIESPLFTFLALSFQVMLRVFPVKKDNLHESGMWDVAKTTKVIKK